MKVSKDPFEAAASDDNYDESPPESPPNSPASVHVTPHDDDVFIGNPNPSSSTAVAKPVMRSKGKAKEEEEENEDEMEEDNDLGKMTSSSSAPAESTDPKKMAKMQSILSQFTDEQMSRYESFRRSGFQKSIMKRLLVSITGSQKISVPMTIVVSGIAKMFVGELVETARVVMGERKDSGPIRPCHIREAYRRLKLEGKIPKRSVPRLFR